MVYLQKIFVTNIKRFRKDAGLTQAQLAERLGVSHSIIRNYENRINFPNAQTIEAIANVLGVYPDELFRDPDREEARPAPSNLPTIFQTLAKHSDLVEMIAQASDDDLEVIKGMLEVKINHSQASKKPSRQA